MDKRTFTWRGGSYRLDSSTWLFWGRAKLIRLPGEDDEYRMAPDDALFVQFAIDAGFEPSGDREDSDLIDACRAHLVQQGHQVWTADEALQIVRDDVDTALAERLMERLIYWFFLAPF